MKIALFYPTCSAWSITEGVRDGFTRMGHTVIDGTKSGLIHKAGLDLIFVSGPEYLWKELRVRYPEWDILDAKKVGWLHETVEREDYGTNPIAVENRLPLEELKRFTPYLFTPAIQDQKYGLRFLPFGVDTHRFHPQRKENLDHAPIYLGSLYPKRKNFLDRFDIRKKAGYRECPTVEEYADILARSSVVLSLPSLSALTVTQVFEVLASRTLLVAPALIYPDGLFEHGRHLLYYDDDPSPLLRRNEEVATRGYDEVLAHHTIEHRLSDVLKAITPVQTIVPIRRPTR